ncbi:B-type cyclin [Basidiobolus ranarum]|uniref:B-type cyclin n=1 Tax=Basidiobolus ranarum TaxID=34480 RepID=A0ABR2WBP3_9FUNG
MDSVQVLTNRAFVPEESVISSTRTMSSGSTASKRTTNDTSSSSRQILGDISNVKLAKNPHKSTVTSENQISCSSVLTEEVGRDPPLSEETGVSTEVSSLAEEEDIVKDRFSFLSDHEDPPSITSEELDVTEANNGSRNNTEDDSPPVPANDIVSTIPTNEDSILMAPEEPIIISSNDSLDNDLEDSFSSPTVENFPSRREGPSSEEFGTSETSTPRSNNAEDGRPAIEFDEFIDMESETNSSHSEERNTVGEETELSQRLHLVEEMDRHDISMVSDYADDIFDYWRELEQKLKPNPDYMSFQSELQWHMRGILLDWLVQVHERFRMLQETLFLSVNYIDRFLSLKEVSIEKFQLVGTTALFIAAKYEEIAAPTINEMIYMVSGTYTCEELKNAEKFMINLLNYELGFPGPLSFLRRISKADHYDPNTRTLAKYLIEVTIMYESFIKYSSSLIAAAGYYLAMRMLGKVTWTSSHQHYSGLEESALLPCVRELLKCLKTPAQHIGIYKKYEGEQYMNASEYVAEYLSRLDVNI